MTAPRITTAAASVLLALCAALRADTVILKSGEKVEGKILEETDAAVTVSVQVTASIKDERVIKRADIDKVEKLAPDDVAWAALAKLAPGNESLERDEYDRAKAALSHFVSTFPTSPHAALAQSRLNLFTSEQTRVSMGEVKVNGQWLSKETVHDERVQIGGHILLTRMKNAAGTGQLTEAMAIFDQLEKTFAGSVSYPDAVELGRRVLASLWPVLEQRQFQLKRRLEDDARRLASSKGTEHAQVEALIKRDTANADAAIAAVERTGVKWLPLQPANVRSLTSLSTRTTAETTRLNNIDTEKMRDSIKATETASGALKFRDFDATDNALKEALQLWPANELAKRLQTKLAEAKKAATPKSGQAAPPPAPEPKPATAIAAAPVPTATPAAPAAPIEREKTSSFQRPIVFVGVAAVVAFGTVAGKIVAKSRAAAQEQ